jgi:hypothetical protein
MRQKEDREGLFFIMVWDFERKITKKSEASEASEAFVKSSYAALAACFD